MRSLRSLLFGSVLSSCMVSSLGAQCALRPDGGIAGDRFSWAFAASGRRLVVGAHRAEGSVPASGSAYLFEFGAGGWSQVEELVPPSPVALQNFGQSVAIAGDTVLVGSPRMDGPQPVSGAAYVFELVGSDWVLTQELLAFDGETYDYFGQSVALDPDGRFALIGAWGDNNAAGWFAGAAYLYERTGSGWSFVQKLAPGDLFFNDQFGTSVAMGAGRAVIGSPNAYTPCGPSCRTGAAYVFEPDPDGTWHPRAKLVAEEPGLGGALGISVALRGDVVVAGDIWYEDRGAAFVYEYDGAEWGFLQTLRGVGLPPAARFGSSVVIDGDEIAVGAPFADEAFAFTRSGDVWTESAHVVNPDGSGRFGWSVGLLERALLVGDPQPPSLGGVVHRFELDPDLQSECFCDGSAPCGNESLCAGCRNSTSSGALLVGDGSTSVALARIIHERRSETV